jgi:dinuclear metal center YbgI/SA1388 family protein
MKIKEITNCLEEIAPLHYQEAYDNSGLIVGDENTEVTTALITIDCTEKVIDEAIAQNCNLIITHHPIVFEGLKRFNGNNYVERTVIKAIKYGIAIYAIHTNLDNVHNGVSAKIAEKLGLENCKVLAPKSDLLRQLVVYCPTDNSADLKTALFAVGAGKIGDYDNCSFSSVGKGTFRAGEEANPHIGKIGEIHTEHEDRIEVIYPKYKERDVLNAMQNNHPYKEVAHQIYVLDNKHQLVGSGIIGELNKPIKSKLFLEIIKTNMQTDCIRHTSLVKAEIKKVAVCGGSGSFLLNNAKAACADIFITADFKYHQFFDAENDIIIADIGHYESEQFTKDLIYDLLTKNFTKFAVQLSKVNTNPINYL